MVMIMDYSRIELVIQQCSYGFHCRVGFDDVHTSRMPLGLNDRLQSLISAD